MENEIKEFINSDGTLISGKIPNVDAHTTAKTTTDKSVGMRTQPYNFTIYNVKLQEIDGKPHYKKANELANNPESFYKFLESINEQDKFEEYFEVNPSNKLKVVSRKKAYEVMETILNKHSKFSDVISKKMVTIDEVKEKETLLLDKLTVIAETIRDIMSEEEKDVIVSYFKDKIKRNV